VASRTYTHTYSKISFYSHNALTYGSVTMTNINITALCREGTLTFGKTGNT
jgi:hypothetical protein